MKTMFRQNARHTGNETRAQTGVACTEWFDNLI